MEEGQIVEKKRRGSRGSRGARPARNVVVVSNLHSRITVREVANLFRPCGVLTEIHLLDGGRCYVQFYNRQWAKRAEERDAMVYEGKALRVRRVPIHEWRDFLVINRQELPPPQRDVIYTEALPHLDALDLLRDQLIHGQLAPWQRTLLEQFLVEIHTCQK
jgi:hypothetical protein